MPGSDVYDLNVLDLRFQTWVKLICVGYIIIALGLKRKQLGRIWRDAFHALVRAKTLYSRGFRNLHEPEEIELTKKAAQATKNPPLHKGSPPIWLLNHQLRVDKI